jgi:hypothetical protein
MVLSPGSPELARLITWDKGGAEPARAAKAAANAAQAEAPDPSPEQTPDLLSEAQDAPGAATPIKPTRKRTVQ